MAFQGSLRELPLPDIIQLVAVSQKSGVFSIEDNDCHGKIFLHRGQIVDAAVGELRGEEAVYELSIWSNGRFQFDQDDSIGDDSATIHKSNTNLLMEAARRKDEWRILAKKIPSTRMVPHLRGSATDGRSFNPREDVVVAETDGQRSIEAIGLKLAESPFEIAKIIYGLVTSGVVELRRADEMSADVAPSVHGDPFDRLSIQQVSGLVTALIATAYEMVESRDSRTALESLRRQSEAPDSSATAAERIDSLVRGAHQLIAEEQGPDQAEVFMGRVEELFKEV